ncbi:hypothetical protein AGMMS50212_01880 [Spirochaetia bacterium]|nr:hypothetical protein AGMMS50212_01880 [Spirochaetia bacterium]
MTVGSFVYTFSQWILTIVIVRISGLATAGIYSLAYSFSTVFAFISAFGGNSYQVSDVNNAHTDSTYLTVRVITCVFSVVAFAVSLIFSGFSAYTILCCLALMCQNYLTSLVRVLFGVFQKFRRYDILGVSNILKGVLPVAAICVTLYFFGLFAALCASLIVYLATILFFDIYFAKKNNYFNQKVVLKDVPHILYMSLYIGLSSLVYPFQMFITKNIIQINYTEYELGGYSSVTIFMHIIVMLVDSITGVMLPELSGLYIKKEFKAIKVTILKIYLITAVCGGVMFLGDYFAGTYALSLILGKKIEPFVYLLSPTIAASMLFALLLYFNTALTAFKKLKSLVAANFAGGILCAIITSPMVTSFGMIGSVYSLIISFALELVILNIIVFYCLREKRPS